jgi:hypothetical protein
MWKSEGLTETLGANMKQTVKIPQSFFNDHINRSDNPADLIAAIVHSNKSSFTVELSDKQFAELYSDAAYYAEGCDYTYLRSLVKSAQATLRALELAVA